jgi:hypothetical protein
MILPFPRTFNSNIVLSRICVSGCLCCFLSEKLWAFAGASRKIFAENFHMKFSDEKPLFGSVTDGESLCRFAFLFDVSLLDGFEIFAYFSLPSPPNIFPFPCCTRYGTLLPISFPFVCESIEYVSAFCGFRKYLNSPPFPRLFRSLSPTIDWQSIEIAKRQISLVNLIFIEKFIIPEAHTDRS